MTNGIAARRAPAPSGTARGTTGAYVLGTLATAAATAYAAADQLVLHGLEAHLHALYDPVGKYGEPAPLYGYLYVVGALGLLCWWANLRLVRRGAPSARLWGWVSLALAALPVFAPLAMREYGGAVIPLGLSAGFLVAWLCGFAGVLALGRRQA
ncbi:hypothetical protein [Tsukamurella sp. 1534]|uniref:hypothetical protein n=1 Tax=Tsukamurella sp. 1534 TaxID=1151061 RepID=UPI000593328A|nr:hypothetical protein [Tsukamurella sp. 1534]